MKRIGLTIDRVIYLAFILVIMAAALAVRLYDLDDAPLDFHPTRQLRLGLITRGLYYADLPGVPERQRQMAVSMGQLEGVLEPQIMETLAANIYRLIGREDLQVGRLLAIFFWIVGGIGLALLSRDIAGRKGSIAALAYYLLYPYGVYGSRSFQPDGLMICLMIYCFWAMNRWRVKGNWRWVVAAGLLGGMAILVKTMAAFFVGGAWLGLVLATRRLPRLLRDRQVWLAGFLTLLPVVVFYFYGIFVSGAMSYIFSQRFFPQMWLTVSFYLRWIAKVSQATGFEWLLLGFAGVFLLTERNLRSMLVGIWIGYFLFGMAFAHFSATHDYYHLPLIPLVALGLAMLAEILARSLRGPTWLVNLVVTGLLVFWSGMSLYEARTTLKRNDYRQETVFWQQLGQKLRPQSSVLALTPDYGMRLEYWGWVIPLNWPTTGDLAYNEKGGQPVNVEELIGERFPGRDFFLVTMLDELDLQPVLKDALTRKYLVFDQGAGYIIYDLRKTR